jgi:hypothetical protein
MTSYPSHHHLPPRCHEPHRCPPPLVSTLPSHAPDSPRHHVIYLSGTFLSSESPPVDWNPVEKHQRGKGIGIPCFGPMGRMALVGQAALAGWAVLHSRRSPIEQCPFSFSIQIISKLNSNQVQTSEIHRDLIIFDKIICSIP